MQNGDVIDGHYRDWDVHWDDLLLRCRHVLHLPGMPEVDLVTRGHVADHRIAQENRSLEFAVIAVLGAFLEVKLLELLGDGVLGSSEDFVRVFLGSEEGHWRLRFHEIRVELLQILHALANLLRTHPAFDVKGVNRIHWVSETCVLRRTQLLRAETVIGVVEHFRDQLGSMREDVFSVNRQVHVSLVDVL